MVLWSPFYNSNLNSESLEITREEYSLKAALYWSIVMFTMIIGAPNFFTDLFNYKILKYVSRFSFGIYLLHPCVSFMHDSCV